MIEYVITEPYDGVPQTVLFDEEDPCVKGRGREFYETDQFKILSKADFTILHDKYLNSLCGHHVNLIWIIC